MRTVSRRRPSPALVISIISLFVSLGGVGVAATGGNFILGQSNTANNTSTLSGVVPGPSTGTTPGQQLQVTNNSTAVNAGGLGVLSKSATAPTALFQNTGGGPPLRLVPTTGKPPLSVGSSARVPNLNADLLDGLSSSSFTQPACTSNTGAVKGFARIAAKTSFPSTFTTTGVEFPYSCSGGTVEARRVHVGMYEIRFNGNGARLAIATDHHYAIPGLVIDTGVGWIPTTGTFKVWLQAEVQDGVFSFADHPFAIVLV
jgi:hypothetical protein